MKDTYTYKQILLGLRPEFLETKQQLDKLREYIIIDEKCRKDYYFDLFNRLQDSKPELGIHINDNQLRHLKLLRLLIRQFGYPSAIRTVMVKDNNGNYYPLLKPSFKKNQFNVRIDYHYKKEFEELASVILNSDFAKMINFDDAVYSMDGISIPRLTLSFYNLVLRTENSQISYLGRDDIIEIASCRKPDEEWKPLTQEHIEYALGIEFPKEKFSEYHQNVIEKNIINDQDIVLADDFQPTLHTKLQINEDGKRLVLSKLQK